MTSHLIVMAATFVGLGPGDSPAVAPRNDSICQQDIKADLFFLSGDRFRGRMTGTPENDLANAFIGYRFERLALKRVGGRPSYDQGFNLVTSSLGPANHLRVGSTNLRPGQDYLPLPISAAGEQQVKAAVVFAGFGVVDPDRGHDDYANLDVSGQIVLVLDHEPGEKDAESPFDGLVMGEAASPFRKAMIAQERGAVGILFVSDVHNHPEPEDFAALMRQAWPEQPPRIPRYLLQDWVDRIRIPAARISTALAPSLLPKAGRSLDDLARASEKPGSGVGVSVLTPVALATDIRHHTVRDRNVLAAIEGSDPKLKDEWVVISCHQDHDGADGNHIYNGADDNASGTVGMLEIAEAYALAAQEGHRPKRSILFAAFNSEERGLLGSWAFVERPPVPLDRIVAALNMDMIGRDEEVPEGGGNRFRGLPVQSAESNHNAVNLMGYSRCAALTRTIERANGAIGLQLKQVLDNNASNLLRRSDQWPFLQRGVPAMFFHTGLHPDYHTPGDRPERINYPKMERIVRLVHQASWDLAQQPDRPGLDARPTRTPRP